MRLSTRTSHFWGKLISVNPGSSQSTFAEGKLVWNTTKLQILWVPISVGDINIHRQKLSDLGVRARGGRGEGGTISPQNYSIRECWNWDEQELYIESLHTQWPLSTVSINLVKEKCFFSQRSFSDRLIRNSDIWSNAIVTEAQGGYWPVLFFLYTFWILFFTFSFLFFFYTFWICFSLFRFTFSFILFEFYFSLFCFCFHLLYFLNFVFHPFVFRYTVFILI